MSTIFEGEIIPLVSVIIPTYNHRRWVTEAIDSALGQTHPNCEIIVVDDGSTDGTGELLLDKYGDEITNIYQTNKGRGAARNRGLRKARGQYVQFLDADDLIMPEKIEMQVAFLERHPEVDVVYGDVLLFYEDDMERKFEHEKRKYYVSGNDLFASMLHEPFLLTVHSLFRRETIDRIGGFDEKLARVQDWDFHLRLARIGAYFQYLPDGGGSLYRQRYVTPAQDRIQAASDAMQVIENFKRGMNSLDIRRLGLRKAAAMARFTYGMEFIRGGSKIKGLGHLFLSLGSFDERLVVRGTYFLLCLFLPLARAEKMIDVLVRTKRYLLAFRINNK